MLIALAFEIGRFFREFAPENPAKFCFFFREISEALVFIYIVSELRLKWNLRSV